MDLGERSVRKFSGLAGTPVGALVKLKISRVLVPFLSKAVTS